MPAKERRPERESRKGDEEAFFHALLEGHDRALPKLIKRNRRLLDILSVREMMTSAHDSKSTKLLPRERKSSSHDHIPESSPLVFALRFGHTSVVRVLLAAGADPNTVDAMHDTPLLAACRLAMDEACDSEPVRLLLEHRANPDLAPAGVQAPLLLSCAKGVAQVVGWLISAGADLDLRDDNGCTALHLSCLRGDAQVAAACTRQLLAAGAEPDAVTEPDVTEPDAGSVPLGTMVRLQLIQQRWMLDRQQQLIQHIDVVVVVVVGKPVIVVFVHHGLKFCETSTLFRTHLSKSLTRACFGKMFGFEYRMAAQKTPKHSLTCHECVLVEHLFLRANLCKSHRWSSEAVPLVAAVKQRERERGSEAGWQQPVDMVLYLSLIHVRCQTHPHRTQSTCSCYLLRRRGEYACISINTSLD